MSVCLSVLKDTGTPKKKENMTKEKLMQYASQISNEEYHSRDCMSATALKQFLKSPAHYKAYRNGSLPDTPSFRFGRIAHSAVLEPNLFDDQYAVFYGDRRTKPGKAEWQSILDTGREPIKHDERHQIAQLELACGDLFPSGGMPELSFHAEINGVMVQCRPDWLCVTDYGMVDIYDLKTCKDITQIDKNFYAYGYHIQAVFYWMVLSAALPDSFEIPKDGMSFVFVEQKDPYDVGVRIIDPDIFDATAKVISDALNRYRECCEKNEWPGVEDNLNPKQAECPAWVKSGLMPEIDLDGFYNNNEAC